MIQASCHCGAIRLEIAEPPVTVTDCNCSICRRMGVLWAYYTPDQVRISGPTEFYMWGDKRLEFHRCQVCGNVTHWAAIDKTVRRMGVNARLMALSVLAAARVRILDGAGTEEYRDKN